MKGKQMELYRLLWGTRIVDLVHPIWPEVPRNTMASEDQSQKRICTSTSLDGCLTGIGPSHIGLNSLKDQLACGGIDTNDVRFPFTALVFQVDRHSPEVMLPGKVAQFVPDAFHSGECWITLPTVPVASAHIWLLSADIEQIDLLVNGQLHPYLMISNSCWSSEPENPAPAFRDAIISAARRYLEEH